MLPLADLLTTLTDAGISLTLRPRQYGFTVLPSAAITAELRALLIAHKPLLMNHLLMEAALVDLPQTGYCICACGQPAPHRRLDGRWQCSECMEAEYPVVDISDIAARLQALSTQSQTSLLEVPA